MSTSKVKGLDELAKSLHDFPDKLQNSIMRGAMRAGAKVLEAEAQKNAPVDKGDLKKSFKVSTRVKGGVVTASVKNFDWKAHWAEYGTAAHWISVKEEDKPGRMTRRGYRKVSMKTLNKMLASGTLKIGAQFAGASVLHPGAKAQPYMRPALDKKATEAVVAVGNYMKKRLANKHGLDTSGITVEADE